MAGWRLRVLDGSGRRYDGPRTPGDGVMGARICSWLRPSHHNFPLCIIQCAPAQSAFLFAGAPFYGWKNKQKHGRLLREPRKRVRGGATAQQFLPPFYGDFISRGGHETQLHSVREYFIGGVRCSVISRRFLWLCSWVAGFVLPRFSQ